MFTNDELKTTKDYCDRKIDDVLNSKDGSDFDYIKKLQTLIKLRESANKAIKPTG